MALSAPRLKLQSVTEGQGPRPYPRAAALAMAKMEKKHPFHLVRHGWKMVLAWARIRNGAKCQSEQDANTKMIRIWYRLEKLDPLARLLLTRLTPSAIVYSSRTK